MALLCRPLAFVVCLWALVHVAWLSFHSAMHAPLSAVSYSLCALPFVEAIGFCPDSSGHFSRECPGLVEAKTRSFGSLLDQATGGSQLSRKLERVEYAVSDLIIMVKFSCLEGKASLGASVWYH